MYEQFLGDINKLPKCNGKCIAYTVAASLIVFIFVMLAMRHNKWRIGLAFLLALIASAIAYFYASKPHQA